MPTLPDYTKIPLCLGYVTNGLNSSSLVKDLRALGHQVHPICLPVNPDKKTTYHVMIWDIWDTSPTNQHLWKAFQIHACFQDIPVLAIVTETVANQLNERSAPNPTAWLLRPVRMLQLQLTLRTLARLGHKSSKTHEVQRHLLPDAIFIKEGTRYRRLPLQDILFLEAERRYCRVVTAKKSYLHTLTLQGLLDQLPDSYFLRVHRSFAVQVNAITALSTKALYIGNQPIPIGELYKEAVKSNFFQFTLKSS